MVRTQLQIDDDTYEALRQVAHEQRRSMSAVVRDILKEHLTAKEPIEKTATTELKKKYPFIGMGKSGKTDISVRHDDYLAEDFR